ncbi:M14 family zinc carboxypeptidase [Conexibacter woesei]|uniref:M14 family zinc carboxypeptidase n=1 Tax=Conexibacter woesei TaxID=191495 RepID=UPI0004056265|nr:M14 family zinc carboxypeptidase [Conexibacter woesei]
MLADTVATAPPALHATVIGRSVRGRPLRVVKVGADDALIKVLIVGCVHGTERAGLAVTRALRREHAPLATQELILDEANPDGCAAGTRGNAHGVDLNRNFPWGWRAQSGIYASGPRPASEPETRAIMAYILKERPQITIWFHQHMNLVDDTRGSEPLIIKAYALSAHMRAHRLAQLPGTATRWQNHRLTGSSSFVVELPSGPMTPLAIRRHIRAIDAATQVVGVPSKR